MVLQNLVLIAAAFLGLWYGSGLIIDSVKTLAKKVRVSSFAFSFFVLGVLTSIPEMAVGLNAISEKRPEIFVGNLLGGIIIIFLVIIPLLALVNSRVHTRKYLSGKNLAVTLGVIAAPALLTLDKAITSTEGFIMIALYAVLFYIIRTKRGVLYRTSSLVLKEQKDLRHSTILKLALGAVVVFFTSRYIVTETIEFSARYGVSTFLVSLVVISIGSNLPEITLALRSFKKRAEEVALGDYLGSAATNTLLFGIFTLINNGEIVGDRYLGFTLLIIIAATISFYLMTRSGNLGRRSGAMLLGFYIIFLVVEASRAI